MSGDEPAHVPDEIIAAIRSRERNGFVELPKKRLQPGDRVQIISGLLAGRRGRYAGASQRHVKVLLQMLGIERQVQLSPDAVEQI
jgi:transcription antitermination factor NusG